MCLRLYLITKYNEKNAHSSGKNFTQSSKKLSYLSWGMKGKSFIQTKLPSFLRKYTFSLGWYGMKWQREDSQWN